RTPSVPKSRAICSCLPLLERVLLRRTEYAVAGPRPGGPPHDDGGPAAPPGEDAEPPSVRPCREPVPAPDGWSALAVLRRLAGLLEAGLLALGDASVTGEQAGLFQGRAVQLGVDRVERPGHAVADRAGLAGGATPVDADEHVVGAVELEDLQRLVDQLLVDLVREVVLQRAAVDLPLAGARDDPDPGHRLLATAGAGAGRGGRRATRGLGRGLGLARVAGELGLLDRLDVIDRHVCPYCAI